MGRLDAGKRCPPIRLRVWLVGGFTNWRMNPGCRRTALQQMRNFPLVVNGTPIGVEVSVGLIDGFKCVICETEFVADEYEDSGENRCPSCGQVYNYDEGLRIALTDEQIRCLAVLKGVEVNGGYSNDGC